MPKYGAGARNPAGFSLLELTLVVTIGLIVTTIGMPRMNNVIANIKLRSSMTTVSGLIQNCRMMAVQRNRTLTAKFTTATNPVNSMKALITERTDTTNTPVAANTQVEMEAPISSMDTPTGTGAPAAITNAALGLSSDPLPSNPSFNSRGLPCFYDTSTGACAPNNAFIRYFRDNRIGGAGAWAAISITPAGRIKRWFWNGSSWTD